MRIVKTSLLAMLVVVTLVGSGWADSTVTASAFKTDLQIVQTDINKNFNLFASSPAAKSAFLAGELAGADALFQNSRGNTKAAQIDFQTAIADFNQVLSVLHQQSLPGSSPTVPDASSLALLGCAGIALFGALNKKFAK